MQRVCGLDVHKDTIFSATFDGKKHGPAREYLRCTLTPIFQIASNFLR